MMGYNHKILIADDSEINRDLLSQMLSPRYDIAEAKNGQEVLDYIHSHPGETDLILLDFIMPKIDGMQVLSTLQAEKVLDDVSVIMITADSRMENIEKAYALGATDYITRPFSASIVRHRVDGVMNLQLRKNELADELSEQVEEKNRISDMMVHILSGIVEFRNGESGAHVLHIRVLTEFFLHSITAITDKYSFNDEEVYNISMGAAMHDIGKVCVPFEILNKPGALTKEEFAVMKSHTLKGAEMLKAIIPMYGDDKMLQTAYAIVRWHHERWDGRGYPDGLKGDEIPIFAQAVALADVYDALTGERCYKKAISHDKAINMILNGECGAFNPVLMKCLENIEPLIPGILKSKKANKL